MSRGIAAIPALNVPPTDIWGRSGAPEDVQRWAEDQDGVQQARQHLLVYLNVCYIDPLAVIQEAVGLYERAAASNPNANINQWAGRVKSAVEADPTCIGELRRTQTPWYRRHRRSTVDDNLRSVPILLNDYLERLASAGSRRAAQIRDQLEKDAVLVPALDGRAYEFFQQVSELKEVKDIIDLWTLPENRSVTRSLIDYVKAVRSRVGHATPSAYLDAVRRAQASEDILSTIRLAMRVMVGVDKIVTIVETDL